MAPPRGGEYGTVGFHELRRELAGHSHYARSATPPAQPAYWYKQHVPFWTHNSSWIHSPLEQSRINMRDGRMHSTHIYPPAGLQPKLVPRDQNARVKKSRTASRIQPVITTSMINGRSTCIPGEEGRLGRIPDPAKLARQVSTNKNVANEWTTEQIMYMYADDFPVESIQEHIAGMKPMYSSFTRQGIFDSLVWQPKRWHDKLRKAAQIYTPEPDPEDLRRARIRRGSVVGPMDDGLDERPQTVPTPPAGRIGRRGSLSFQICCRESATPPPAAAISRSQSPYVLRARMNSSAFPPKPGARPATADGLPTLKPIVTGSQLSKDGIELRSPLSPPIHAPSPTFTRSFDEPELSLEQTQVIADSPPLSPESLESPPSSPPSPTQTEVSSRKKGKKATNNSLDLLLNSTKDSNKPLTATAAIDPWGDDNDRS